MVRNNPVSFNDSDGRNPFLACFGPSAKQSFKEKIQAESSSLKTSDIPKTIHLIWIGTGELSDKNANLSRDTAAKNPDYITNVIYDSGIKGYEPARDYLISTFRGSDVNVVDIRAASYFSSISSHPAFKYYEEAINAKQYAKASDLLRLSVLANEGGVYKDIDDTQKEAFGNLSLPGGIGVKRAYTASGDGSKASAIPNTPIAAIKEHPTILKTLDLAVRNYQRGEKNILKLAGPDVLTEALYEDFEILQPGYFEKWDKIKQEVFKKSKLQLTIDEVNLLNEPRGKMFSVGAAVTSGADHSWHS
ncbi:TPA: TcdA/TcdB catalytic glycosyltransferase domain-containing protein [Pseudomonas aeruginosa]